jgi:hypothetical protein
MDQYDGAHTAGQQDSSRTMHTWTEKLASTCLAGLKLWMARRLMWPNNYPSTPNFGTTVQTDLTKEIKEKSMHVLHRATVLLKLGSRTVVGRQASCSYSRIMESTSSFPAVL